MKEIIKRILTYILVFFITVITLTLALVGTAKIPKEWIEGNIDESTSYLSKNSEINYIKRKHPYIFLHIYADELLLNIIYNIDTDKPLESVLEAKYYNNGKKSLKQQMENKELVAQQEYIRYWHGSMIVVRPLLTIFNIYGMYAFMAVTLAILVIVLLTLLWRKKHKGLMLAFIIAFLLTGSSTVAFCLEYVWMYLVMLVISIIAICIEKKGNKPLNILLFISGILACFFDFLTTELITVLVPLIFVLMIRYKDKRTKSLKEELKQLLISLIIWFIGYSMMWVAKWILASIILNVNALDYVREKAFVRINGSVIGVSTFELYLGAITKNLMVIFPLNLIRNKYLLYSLPIIFIIAFLFLKKDKKQLKFMIPLIIMGLIPYLRYLILANHSYRHYFFTFRTQFASVMVLCLIFIFGIDKTKFNKQIKIKKNKEK